MAKRPHLQTIRLLCDRAAAAGSAVLVQAAGELVDLPADEAQRLIASGAAEAAGDPSPSTQSQETDA